MMTSTTIKQIKFLKPIDALDALNRLTNLKWREYPSSLLPNGMVINNKGVRREKYEYGFDVLSR